MRWAPAPLREKHLDAVTIGNGEVLERVAFADMQRVWRRATFALPGAMLGSLAGLLVGGLVAMKVFSLLADFLAGKALLIGALIMAGLGALFGGAVGAWIPRWTRVWGCFHRKAHRALSLHRPNSSFRMTRSFECAALRII